MDEPVTGDVCRRAKSRKMINVDFGIIEREKSLKIFCTTTTEKFEPKITATKEVRNYEVIFQVGMGRKKMGLMCDSMS